MPLTFPVRYRLLYLMKTTANTVSVGSTLRHMGNMANDPMTCKVLSVDESWMQVRWADGRVNMQPTGLVTMGHFTVVAP